MATDLFDEPPRSLSMQSVILLTTNPQFALIEQGRRYVWRGTLQPSPMSSTYLVRIAYDGASRPVVEVLDPLLRPRGRQPIPHRFSDGSLCLYTPGGWRPSESIAATIIPWAAEWLLYYEAWQVTGQWLGGGEHPVASPRKGQRR